MQWRVAMAGGSAPCVADGHDDSQCPAGRQTRRRTSGLAGQLLADDRGALHESSQLVLRNPTRRFPESTIGIQPELVGGDMAQQRAGALCDLVRGLGLE